MSIFEKKLSLTLFMHTQQLYGVSRQGFHILVPGEVYPGCHVMHLLQHFLLQLLSYQQLQQKYMPHAITDTESRTHIFESVGWGRSVTCGRSVGKVEPKPVRF